MKRREALTHIVMWGGLQKMFEAFEEKSNKHG